MTGQTLPSDKDSKIVASAKNNDKLKENTKVNPCSPAQINKYKTKAAEISEKMKVDVNKARNETEKLERDMRTFAVKKAGETYKITHLKKGQVDTARFDRAVNNTIKKEISNDANYQKYKTKAAVHYKKMTVLNNKIEKLNRKLDKAENRSDRKEGILKAAEAAATFTKSPAQAMKNIAADQLRKTQLGNAIINASSDMKTFDEASKANSLADGTSAAVTALPEKYVKNVAHKTVTNALSGKRKSDKIENKKKKTERKYGREAAKAERAERKAKYAKESAKLRAKVQFYKEEKGLIKSASITKNIKQSIKNISKKIGKVTLQMGKKAIVGIITSALPVLLVLLIIMMVLIALFSWMTPHTETLYDDTTKSYATIEVEDEKDVLEGYIHHIRDYFDKKQLEILEVTELEFGGFDPDD